MTDMTRVFATRINPRTQKPLKKMLLWAAFRNEGEAHDYSQKLQKLHPTWYIKVIYPGQLLRPKKGTDDNAQISVSC